ncbi:MAG: Crp/Fnr family transcriptional regulator [Saprospiraceae bacterium]|nr:Crp/Fnr family transcriptional regulator [Pyrinomonadaceae bacterium]
MPEDKITIFKQTELFRDLDEVVLEVLAKHSIVKHLQRNEILFLAGEPANGLYLIASGSVRAFRTSADGREQVIHLEKAVTTIAEVPVFDNGNYPSTAAAEEETTLYFLSKQDVIKTAIEHPQLALAAARLIASRLRRCAELVETLSLREVGQRLARLLLEEARNNGTKAERGTKIELRLTHDQLAARIGTVREVVTRALIRLQEKGLIVHKGKDILITDIKLIAAYAEAENTD